MSTTIESVGQAQATLLVRTFRADVGADFSKREIEGVVVPFDVKTRVADPPDFAPYEESVAPGAFRAVVKAPNRVLLDFEHYGALTNDALGSMGSIAGTLGHALHLEEQAAGLYGNFRVLRGSDGDKALELASEGVLGGFSVAMRPLRSVRTQSGAMQRTTVHLDRVSLCRVGAYEQARVMAVRTAPDEVIEEADMPKPLDPLLAVGLSRFGIPVGEETLLRAFSETSWDGSASRWDTADAYCAASAIDMNTAGRPKTKDACHLPFREPGSGAMNVNAIRAALARLGAGEPADVPASERLRARLMLERMLAQHNSQQGAA